MDGWIANAVGKMHVNKISNIDVAKKLNFTVAYVSIILNGKKTPKDAETRIMSAIDEIIAERNAG